MRTQLTLFYLILLGQRAQNLCNIKSIEGISYKNQEFQVEHIRLNEILQDVFTIHGLAMQYSFTVEHGNVISTYNTQICEDSGIGFELGQALDLQLIDQNIGNYLEGRMLVYSNETASALLFGQEEIAKLMVNYKVSNNFDTNFRNNQ